MLQMEKKGRVQIRCGKCGTLIGGDVYEFKDMKLCEDCYMDEVIASQPKKCIMK